MSNDESLSIQQKFQRAVESRRSRRQAERPQFEDAVANREAQRQRWTSPNRSNSISKPDASLAEARANWEAEQRAKKAASQAPTQVTLSNPLSDEEEFLLARAWANSNPEWYASDYNADQMKKILEHFDLPHTQAGYDSAFAYGTEHGHFEQPLVRKRSGFRMQHAPTPFNPKPTAAPVQPRTHAGNTPVRILPQQMSPEESKELREIPLSELRDRARKGMRAYNPNPEEHR